jgi:CBS domain-containing protein
MKVKDLMMPLSECPKVSGDQSLSEAIFKLEADRERLRQSDYRPRFLLVLDEHSRVIGSVRHADMLRGLLGGSPPAVDSEPGDPSYAAQISSGRKGVTGLFSTDSHLKVKAVTHFPTENEYLEEDAPVKEAACRLIAGPYLNLFVRSGNEITGILRMSDLFQRLCEDLKLCEDLNLCKAARGTESSERS